MRYRHTLLLFGIFLPTCLVLRALQLIFTIDSATGFIKQQYSAISVIITLVIFAAIISVGIISLATEGIKLQKKDINPSLAIFSFFTGCMFIYNAVASNSIVTAVAWYNTLLFALSLASAGVFIACAIKNVYSYKFPNISLIIPVFYFIIKLISVFVSTSQLALVTENIFLIFANGSVLIFMFEFSKIENAVDEAPSIKKLFCFAILAIIFCLIYSLPKILVYGASMSGKDLADALLTLVMGLFVLTYVISNFKDTFFNKNIREAKHLAE